MLAWFSHRPEVAAGDVLAWAKAQTHAILTEHVSLARLGEWHKAREAERRDAMLALFDKNRQAAEGVGAAVPRRRD